MGRRARELDLKENNMSLILRARFFVICLLLCGFFLSQAALAQPQIPASPKPHPVILEFSRDLCAMCEQMKKPLEKLQAKYGDQIEIRLVHFGPNEKLFKQYQVALVPTQVFLDASGKEVFRQTGVFPLSELEKKLKQLKLLQTP
jgi:thioredoxin 1